MARKIQKNSYHSEKRQFEQIVKREDLRMKTDFIEASKKAPFIDLIMYVFNPSTLDEDPTETMIFRIRISKEKLIVEQTSAYKQNPELSRKLRRKQKASEWFFREKSTLQTRPRKKKTTKICEQTAVFLFNNLMCIRDNKCFVCVDST